MDYQELAAICKRALDIFQLVTRARELAPSDASAYSWQDVLWAYVALLLVFFMLHYHQAPPFLPVYPDRIVFRLFEWTLDFIIIIYIPSMSWIGKIHFFFIVLEGLRRAGWLGDFEPTEAELLLEEQINLEEQIDQALIPLAPKDLSENGDTACSICLEPLHEASVVETPCKHRFHDNCVRKWLTLSAEYQCPLCRVDVVPLALDMPE